MFDTGGHCADSALRSAPVALTLNHYDSFGSRSAKTSSPLQLRFFAQRFSQQLYEPDLSLRPPSPADTIRPSRPTNEAGFRKRRPRHVPIVISPEIIQSVLKDLPPSPKSLENTPEPSPPLTHSSANSGDWTKPVQHRRPRHIPIVIPDFAQPQSIFPPTPSASADNTPKASPKLHSCEAYYPTNPTKATMSRPTTSGSRTSTLDSNVSAPSPNQMNGGRFKPSSSTYLADMNSSSETSLNHPGQEAQITNSDVPLRNIPESAQTSTDGSPQAAAQATHTNGTTNLSGLVCNVHKCTGREPLARVGATTTILGDKLYVFGGRILSRKQSMKVTSDMYELDLVRRHWTRIETMGSPPKPRYFHTMCTLGDTKLICYGGMSPAPLSTSQPPPNSAQPGADPMENMMVMSDIHVYDTIKRTWIYIPTSDTPPGRYAHCAAVVPSSATFTSASAPLSAILHNPPSAIPNQGSLGVALDGSGGAEMIVVGGQDSHNKYIDTISVFNLRNLRWTDTQPLERSCGAYRSVVTPLSTMPATKIGAGPDQENGTEASSGAEVTSSMLIYSNYNFLDVKLELQARLSDGSLIEKEMTGSVSPPGLRFPSGDILDNHFIVSGTYLTSSKHEYALWALDLKAMTWSRIDAGGGIFSQGSWNRGVLWARRNTFVILGNRKRVLVDDYNRRRINFSNICMVELEAFGLYDNPRRAWPTSNYPSISAPVLPSSIMAKSSSLGGRPLTNAAIDLGLMAMKIRDLADMDLLAIGGERIPVNSYLLARRWGPYFIQVLRDSGSSASALQNDASSSSDGGTLRPGHPHPSSITSRNSSITITPSVANTSSTGASSLTVNSNSSPANTTLDPPTPQSLPPSSRPRQLYLPHTHLTLRALVLYLYTASLPHQTHELCTPQILCSLLQLARPYRVDGLLEATVERLHQVLDGRNAAAVFNAAAMAAGGGRGTGTAFGKEGDLDAADELQTGGLTITRLQGRSSNPKNGPYQRAGDSSEDSESASASSNPTSENTSEAEAVVVNGPRKVSVGTADEVWSGGVSCVVGLQKRGLRGLMEGRRMREREKGRTVGGLADGSTAVAAAAAANGTVGNGVGLGIA